MGGRIAGRAPRSNEPQPFSSEWLASERLPEAAPIRFHLPAWIPDGRALSAILVVAVSLATALVTIRGNQSVRLEQSPPTVPAIVATVAPTAIVPPTVAPSELTAVPQLNEGNEMEGATPAIAQAPSLTDNSAASVASPPSEGPLLPDYRIVTFYGHPHDPNMGIVGEQTMEEIATAVKDQAANYAAADPSRPVIPAFELIATVAQRNPGADGTYILDTDHETLTSYIDYAEANGMLVILDLQVGRGTVANEIEKVRDLLARPNVHLAIDPEFAVAEGQTPGEYIGSVPAESIAYAQKTLADISAQNGIPPKILIVHQFREDMIQGKEQLAPYPGVQLVIDADGYGAPELKTAVYNFIVRDAPIEYSGVKLFFKQDSPLLTPQEILALVPAPDVIIYQ
jgi:hypothetical protein